MNQIHVYNAKHVGTIKPVPHIFSQGKFEEVRFTSHRFEAGPTKRMQQLELGNKFGALQND